MARCVEAWGGALAARLAAAGVEPGAAVAFPCPAAAPAARRGGVSPLAAVTLDLALQAAGFEPVPVAAGPAGTAAVDGSPPTAAAPGVVAAVIRVRDANGSTGEGSGMAAADGEAEHGEAEDAGLAGWEVRALGEEARPPSADVLTGSPADTTPVSAGVPSLADLFAAAETLIRLREADPPAEPPSLPPRHEVAVTTAALERPGERLLLAWSLLAGAVLVLEPEPAARVATAVWARPTVFAGSADEIERLAREADGWQRDWQQGWTARLASRLRPPVLPFGRLHTVVLDAPPATPPPTADWHRQGVAVHHLPHLLP